MSRVLLKAKSDDVEQVNSVISGNGSTGDRILDIKCKAFGGNWPEKPGFDSPLRGLALVGLELTWYFMVYSRLFVDFQSRAVPRRVPSPSFMSTYYGLSS